MKNLPILIMRVSYIFGILALLAAAVVRLAWLIHRGLGHNPQHWFVCAGALFLCSLASDRMSQLSKE